MDSIQTEIIIDRKQDVEFNCIENFDSQLSLSIEQDLNLVSDQLEYWSNQDQSLQKNAQEKPPLASVSLPAKLEETEAIQKTEEKSIFNPENSTLKNSKINSNVKDTQVGGEILNNEDLNLFDAEEIQLLNPIQPVNNTKSPNEQQIPYSVKSNMLKDVPQQRMIDDDWNPNKVSKRLPAVEDTPTKRENPESEQVSIEPKEKVRLPLESESKIEYEKNYVEKLESSYENKFNLMIALYATTFILLIIVVVVLIWYCKRQMSSIKRGVEYRTNTFAREGFEGDRAFGQKEGSVDG